MKRAKNKLAKVSKIEVVPYSIMADKQTVKSLKWLNAHGLFHEGFWHPLILHFEDGRTFYLSDDWCNLKYHTYQYYFEEHPVMGFKVYRMVKDQIVTTPLLHLPQSLNDFVRVLSYNSDFKVDEEVNFDNDSCTCHLANGAFYWYRSTMSVVEHQEGKKGEWGLVNALDIYGSDYWVLDFYKKKSKGLPHSLVLHHVNFLKDLFIQDDKTLRDNYKLEYLQTEARVEV